MTHHPECQRDYPGCICNTCGNDYCDTKKDERYCCCCVKGHRRNCEDKNGCPDYVKEK